MATGFGGLLHVLQLLVSSNYSLPLKPLANQLTGVC
jgi:hypothetical protein